jgi:peptidyl-prolyl cis-trans isomerase C
VRHILIGVGSDSPPDARDKARKKAQDLLKQIQDGGDFAQLAAANSDDARSKAQGGNLPPLARGQLPPEFEKAAFALAKHGDLSPVVETSYGFHIIQMGERKQATVKSLDEEKDKISKVLQERKALEAIRARVKTLREGGKVQVYLS